MNNKDINKTINLGAKIGFFIALAIFIYRVFSHNINRYLLAGVFFVGIIGIIFRVLIYNFIDKGNLKLKPNKRNSLLGMSTFLHYAMFEVLIVSTLGSFINRYGFKTQEPRLMASPNFSNYVSAIQVPMFFLFFIVMLVFVGLRLNGMFNNHNYERGYDREFSMVDDLELNNYNLDKLSPKNRDIFMKKKKDNLNKDKIVIKEADPEPRPYGQKQDRYQAKSDSIYEEMKATNRNKNNGLLELEKALKEEKRIKAEQEKINKLKDIKEEETLSDEEFWERKLKGGPTRGPRN